MSTGICFFKAFMMAFSVANLSHWVNIRFKLPVTFVNFRQVTLVVFLLCGR